VMPVLLCRYRFPVLLPGATSLDRPRWQDWTPGFKYSVWCRLMKSFDEERASTSWKYINPTTCSYESPDIDRTRHQTTAPTPTCSGGKSESTRRNFLKSSSVLIRASRHQHLD
jgi:hypothetical protein